MPHYHFNRKVHVSYLLSIGMYIIKTI